MKFSTVLDRDEAGVWIAECPSIPGCVSQVQTKEDALANSKEASVLCLEVRAECDQLFAGETVDSLFEQAKAIH